MQQSKLSTDNNNSLVLLQALFSRVNGDAWLTLWLKSRSGKNKTLWIRADSNGLEQMAAEGLEHAKSADVYFSTCPAVDMPTDNPSSKRITQKNVACVPAMFIDCDTLEDQTKTEKSLPADKHAAIQGLLALPLPPSILVNSGHGIHAYWILDTPCSPTEGKKMLKAFARSVAERTGWTGLDVGASETARILRLPGTLNHKEDPPLEVSLLEEGTSRVYTIAEVETFINKAGDERTAMPASDDGEAYVMYDPIDPSSEPGKLSDSEVINKASKATGGDKFMALMSGDTSAYKNDASAADEALCCLLAFWTGKDAAQIDRIFRTSGLMRDKWDRKTGNGTYGSLTIENAIKLTQSVYEQGERKDKYADIPNMTPIYEAFNKVPGYGMHQGGIVRKKENLRGEIELITLSNFSALIRKTISRNDGVSIQKEYVIDGLTFDGYPLDPVTVKLNDFNKMEWAGIAWGNEAIISPGLSSKDHLRYAIQCASNHTNPQMGKETVYTHIGWTEINGQLVYLYHGGSVGTSNARVELDGILTAYNLPDSVKDVDAAIKASIKLLDVAHSRIAFPVLAHTYLAPLCHFLRQAGTPPAFTLYMAGGTGTRKSTYAALEMAHYGKEWNGRRMPANFNDTANALMQKAFLCKDAPLLVDDFRPSSNVRERSEMNVKAQRLATGWGDYAARSRLRSDSTMEGERPPRGIGLITGEDAPNITESGTARFYVVPVKKTDIPISNALKQMQIAGRDGLLAEAMRAYIEYIAGLDSKVFIKDLHNAFIKYRDEANEQLEGAHGRSAEAVAFLWLGLRNALNFFKYHNAISDEEYEEYWRSGRDAIMKNATTQRDEMKEEKPTFMYLQALCELASSGEIQLIPLVQSIAPLHEYIGYYDDKGVYMNPGAAYKAVQEHYRKQGSSFPLNKQTLHKRLAEEGCLLTIRHDQGYTPIMHIPHKKKSERLLPLNRIKLLENACDPVSGLPTIDVESILTTTINNRNNERDIEQ